MSRTVLFLSCFNSRVIPSQRLPDIQDLSVDSRPSEGVRNFERLIGQWVSVPYQLFRGLVRDGVVWAWCGIVIGTIVLGNEIDICPPPEEFVSCSVKVAIIG